MKKLFGKTWVRVISFIFLYIIGLIIGISIIGLYPIYVKQKPGIVGHSYSIGEEYSLGLETELTKMRNTYRHILIFDESGKCVRLETFDTEHSVDDFVNYLSPWLNTVMNGKEVFRITDSRFSPSLLHFWMMSGVPVYKDGRLTCAVFMIENIQNLPEAVLGYIIYFSVFFWLSIYLITITRRRRQRLEQVKQEYIANITHALKTPNASIKAMVETLCDDVIDDPDKKKVYYGRILQEVNSQNRMVSEILELSKLQTDQKDFSKSTVTAKELLTEVTEKYEVLCDCTDLHLHTAPDIFELPAMYTNAECVKQVFELLLDNAIKFVPEGGDVWIDASVSKKKVTFSVKDNGIGISEKDLPHIFERFYRCNRSDASNGSGLGLAIAKELMDGLGEIIWAESKPDSGASFFFTVSRR